MSRCQSPAGTVAPWKALDHKGNAGVRKSPEGGSWVHKGGRKDGDCQEAREALNAGATEALGRDIPGRWETVAVGRAEGGHSITVTCVSGRLSVLRSAQEGGLDS